MYGFFLILILDENTLVGDMFLESDIVYFIQCCTKKFLNKNILS